MNHEAETEEIDAQRLHLILEGTINNYMGSRDEDQLGEAIDMGLRDPDSIGHVGIAVGYEGMAYDPEDTVMSDGLVKAEQSSIDMHGDEHDHSFAVLDEGCNTTCHSRRWEAMESRFLSAAQS